MKLSVNKKIVAILRDIEERIAGIFLYALIFYTGSRIFSYWIRFVRTDFNWPAFHIIIGIVTLIWLLQFLKNKKIDLNIFYSSFYRAVHRAVKKTRKEINYNLKQDKPLVVKIIAKIAVLIIAAYILCGDIVPTFIITITGIIFLLWNIPAKVAATCATFFLLSVLFFSITRNVSAAEAFSLYAYLYFFITVVSVWRAGAGKKLSTDNSM